MTVCVGVAVNDCLVFAADSAATLVSTDPATGLSRIVNVYRHGDKVFNLCKGLPICAMTCGMGNIGAASIATLSKDLRRRILGNDAAWRLDPVNYTVQEIAATARRFLYEDRFQSLNPQPAAPHSLEYWVGGYGSDPSSGHEVWKIAIVNGQCDPPAPVIQGGNSGILFGGQPSAIHRLLFGFDQGLADALIAGGLDPAGVPAVVAMLRSRLEVSMVAPTMPAIDAIDLADFLVETTKRYFRFLPGADIVGGDTDIAVVTRYEGFKWIRRKYFYSRDLNPLETGHV
jgi:hypothetical protein